MAKIEYNDDYIETVSNLSTINPQMIFKKSGDKVVLQRGDKNKRMGYVFTAPSNYFSFDGDELAIADFPNFRSSMKAFGVSSMTQNANMIVMKFERSVINYHLSDPHSLMASPKEIIVPEDYTISFNLSSNDLSDIIKSKNVVKSDLAHMMYSNGKVTARFISAAYSHTFDKEFVCDKNSGEDFEIMFTSDVFLHIPSRENYIVKITKDRLISLEFSRANMYFAVITGRVKKVEARQISE